MTEEDLFHLALKQPLTERESFLVSACDDELLRERVQALLSAHTDSDSFMRQPALRSDQANGQTDSNNGHTLKFEGTDSFLAEHVGASIGPYKLLQPIGEGGMGVVFMAEQSHPVQRRVALKVIKPGMDTRQVVARLEAERQALALMDHPNIARVFDAGTTANGRPYFVMELVKGVPITQYCDEQRLSPRQRLELFVPVCQAVQHAHQKGVIHRDLKPSNVMIALYDGVPVPKVIDFGVAKATGPKLTDRTLFTEFGSVIGTLEYMSPEQAELNQLDIDTRSDVYSLGVLLYELLTGSTPLESSQVAQTALLEVLRIIREVEPPAPSARISSSAELPAIAAARSLDTQKLRGALRGELDWIVMKALDKKRSRRYETASGLASDIERYLKDEPVLACSPSATYRLAKFCKRNRRFIATAALLAVALIILSTGAMIYAFQQRRLAQERAGLALEKEQLQRETAADLYRALLGRAAAVRAARTPGYRKEVWDYLHEAASLNVPDKDVQDIQSQVLDTLADPLGLESLTDVKLETRHRAQTSQQLEKFREAIPANAHRIAYSLSGDMLAVAEPRSEDGTDQASFTITLKGSNNEIVATSDSEIRHHIYELEFSPDGTRLAAACEEGLVLLDVPSLRQVLVARGDSTLAIAFDPEGNRLATLNNNQTVEVWHYNSGRIVASFHGPSGMRNLAFTDDGQHLVGTSGGTALIAWPIRDTPEHRVLLGHQKGVPAVAFNPDGRYLVSVAKDGMTKVWNVHTGKLELEWSIPQSDMQSVAFHPDGKILATADWQGRVIVRSFPSGDMISVLTMPHGKRNWALGFCAKGRYLAAVASEEIAIWELKGTSKSQELDLVSSTDTIKGAFSAAMHPSRLELAVFEDLGGKTGSIYRYIPLRGKPKVIAGLTGARHLHMQEFDTTGEHLRFIREDGSIGIWNWRQKQLVSVLRPSERSTGFSSTANGRLLETQLASSGRLLIFDLKTGSELLRLPAEPSPFWCRAWSPNGSYLAGGLADGTVVLWNINEVWARLGEFGISPASGASRDMPDRTAADGVSSATINP
jgi:serine/threonine protein kinase/WD40 repeat protein